MRVGASGPHPDPAGADASASTSTSATAHDGGMPDAALPDAMAPSNVTSVQSPDGGLTCAHSGAETKLPVGAGTDAFAFAWDTDHYVVVYVDPASGNGDVTVATLGADGSLRTPPTAVEATPAASDLPNLVKTSTGYLVVWEEGSAGESIQVHALDADGAPTGGGASVGTTTLQLFQDQQARPVAAAAPNGQAAVAWMDSLDGAYGIELAGLDVASLQVTGPARIAAADQTAWPWLASDSQGVRVLFSDLPSVGDGAPPVYGMRYASVAMASLAATPIETLPTVGPYDAQLGRMIPTTFGTMAAWEDEGSDNGDNQIEMALLDTKGARIAGGVVEEPHSGDANWPNLAWDGARAAVVYYQWRDGAPQIFMTLVEPSGARAAGPHDLQVSSGTMGGAKYPDVAWTGSEFGVVYIDTRSGSPELWFQRIACH